MKYSLIDEPRDVFKNNDRARTFPWFQNQQIINIMAIDLKQQVIISNNDLLFHLNDLFLKVKIIACLKQWKIA